jgi:hypothetical protein
MRNSISKAYLLSDPQQPLSVTKTSVGDPAVRLPQQKEFLPVVAVDFAGPLDVRQGAVIEPQSDGTLSLQKDQAEHFLNLNGEGYYDAPTLRKQKWVFSVAQSGRYQLQLEIAPSRLSRLLDVEVNGQAFPVIVYGRAKHPAIVGNVQLTADKDIVVTVERGKPAERGEVLDPDIQKVILKRLP